SFEAALMQNLGSTFPDEMLDYQQILKNDEAMKSDPVVNTMLSDDTSSPSVPEQTAEGYSMSNNTSASPPL
ncbi:hypothetical protein BX616_006551, partial [Lobosporangium transversale]